MNDKEIIAWLSSVCNFQHSMSGDVCKFISFFDDKDVFGGTIRHHPLKKEIIGMVSNLSNLTFLNLKKCKIGNIPQMASRSLEWLDLSSNDLEVVPNWVTLQPNLGFLSLGANNLTNVPDLSDLIMMRTLKLHKNRLTKVSGIPKDVASLNLFLNPLENGVPELVKNLWNLESFSFGMCDAKKIPPFAGLPKLKWLVMACSGITELPDDICSLLNLKILVLPKNQITKLPERIGDLVNLKSLSLYYNSITDLPESFFDLKLERLNLYKNPLLNRERVSISFSNIDLLKV